MQGGARGTCQLGAHANPSNRPPSCCISVFTRLSLPQSAHRCPSHAERRVQVRLLFCGRTARNRYALKHLEPVLFACRRSGRHAEALRFLLAAVLLAACAASVTDELAA